MCYWGQGIETTTHFPINTPRGFHVRFHVVSTWNPRGVFVGFLLHCPNHHCARKTLFHKINQVSGIISRQSDSTITKILLFGDNKLDFETLLMQNFKDAYNRVYFINREIHLSLIRVKLNDSIVSFYS